MAKRDPYFDNAKFVLGTLIVLGHTLESFFSVKLAMALYLFLYLFHIPCFVLISGYFSKGINSTEKICKLFNRVLVPYFIFEVLYSIFDYFLFDRAELVFSFMTPYWLIWYLLSLFCWYMMILIFNRLKIPVVIAFIIGLLSGYFTDIGYYLSLSRTLVFFPFFIMGYYLRKEHFEMLAQRRYKVIAAALIVITASIVYVYSGAFDQKWLYGSYPYKSLDSHLWRAWIMRLSIYAVTVLLSISLFSLIPQRQTFMTALGSRIIYVYLFHGFIVKYILANKFFNLVTSEKHLLIAIPVTTIMITLLLSSKTFYYLTVHLVQPKIDLLMIKK